MGTLYDILVGLVLVFELVLGLLDGFWVRFLRFLGLLLAVAVSAAFTRPLCNVLYSVFPLNSIKFGLLIWLFLLVLVASLAWLLVRWAEHSQDKKKGGGFLSVTSHLFGGVTGCLHGVLLILLVTWGCSMMRVNFFPRAPSFEKARSMPLVERMNEVVAFAAIYPSVEPETMARRVAWQLAHPTRTALLWDELLQQDSFMGLLGSDSFWHSVLRGDEWAIMANESFQNLIHDQAAMNALRILILPVKDYKQFEARNVLAARLAELGQAYVRIRDQEKVASLVRALQEEQQFSSGRRVALVKDMRFVRLVAHVMREASPVAHDV